jgi:hypothetical protein
MLLPLALLWFFRFFSLLPHSTIRESHLNCSCSYAAGAVDPLLRTVAALLTPGEGTFLLLNNAARLGASHHAFERALQLSPCLQLRELPAPALSPPIRVLLFTRKPDT